MGPVLQTILPVVAIVALGALLAARRPLDVPTLADLAILVTSPALMFSVLAGSPVDAGQWAVLVGGTLFVAAGTAVLAFAYTRWDRTAHRGFLLPSVFWNAGNIALPCARLAFGEEGLEAAAIVFVTMAVLTSTAGIGIAKGKGGAREILRIPLVYASVGGIVCAVFQIELPRVVMEPVEMLGAMAIPLMLLNLGVQLRRLKLTVLRHAVASVSIRIGAGGLLAFLFVAAFGVVGVNRQILILDAVMPAAVINVVLAQRYDIDSDAVASAILLGTLASAVVIPTVLYLLI